MGRTIVKIQKRKFCGQLEHELSDSGLLAFQGNVSDIPSDLSVAEYFKSILDLDLRVEDLVHEIQGQKVEYRMWS